MWRYVLLEIYSNGDEFPKEGTPADWIERCKVSYCSVPLYNYTRMFSLRELVMMKLHATLDDIQMKMERFEFHARRWLSDHGVSKQ